MQSLKKGHCYLGVDVGGTKIAAALVGPGGTIKQTRREPTDQSSPSSAAEQLSRIIDSYSANEPAGVGIGIPGIADKKCGTVWAPNIKGWDSLSTDGLLQTKHHAPVIWESDRNTALLGEVLYGEARGFSDAACLIIGTGIGLGILSGGRLVRGAGETAGAIGWIPAYDETGWNHFEDLAAGPAIERRGKRLGLPGSLTEIAGRARRGDRTAVHLLSETGTVIGQALSVIVSVLDPEVVIIGGGVSQVWDLLKDSSEETMLKWSQPIAVERVRVVPSALGDRSGFLGAAAAAQYELEGLSL